MKRQRDETVVSMVEAGLLLGKWPWQCLSAMRLPGRGAGWSRMQAPTPTGGPSKIIVSTGKLPSIVQRETGIKLIKRATGELCSNEKFRIDRERDLFTLNWKALAKNTPQPGNEQPKIEHSFASLRSASLDQDRLRQTFQPLFAAASADQEWSL
ncbi:unnamed protein product [Prorocentrum cordatum]|uniref:Uncharacterized protein n=1 Tax=Prorocentrum cordatum TaxID=2364126 RepID=A0ABN9VW79_9DINO|nr:unnamed protein product [Polarella glacialis]